MSEQAKEMLSRAAKETGMSKTQVLETCVAMPARNIPALAESLKKQLTEMIARNMVQDQNKK